MQTKLLLLPLLTFKPLFVALKQIIATADGEKEKEAPPWPNGTLSQIGCGSRCQPTSFLGIGCSRSERTLDTRLEGPARVARLTQAHQWLVSFVWLWFRPLATAGRAVL
jgi:hypothetical protein